MIERFYTRIEDIKLDKGAGYVYVAKFRNRIKIGFTTIPRDRAIGLYRQTGEMFEGIFFCGHFTCGLSIEKALHNLFNAERITTEWFMTDFNSACDELRKFKIYSHTGKLKNHPVQAKDLQPVKYRKIEKSEQGIIDITNRIQATGQILFSAHQVMNLIGIKHDEIYREMNSGVLKTCQLKKKRLIHIDDLLDYLNLIPLGSNDDGK